jgi:hypothetical protein
MCMKCSFHRSNINALLTRYLGILSHYFIPSIHLHQVSLPTRPTLKARGHPYMPCNEASHTPITPEYQRKEKAVKAITMENAICHLYPPPQMHATLFLIPVCPFGSFLCTARPKSMRAKPLDCFTLLTNSPKIPGKQKKSKGNELKNQRSKYAMLACPPSNCLLKNAFAPRSRMDNKRMNRIDKC